MTRPGVSPCPITAAGRISRGTWGWVPGPVRARRTTRRRWSRSSAAAIFQLAIGTGNVGGVAWFPLGPRDVYRPSYAVSRGYFENVNRSNTVINTTVINNYYNNTNVTNVVYANRQVPGAVVAVPTTAFVQSQPVSRAAVRVSRDDGRQRSRWRSSRPWRRPRKACVARPPKATSRLPACSSGRSSRAPRRPRRRSDLRRSSSN